MIGENLIFLEELGNERHDMYGTRMDGVEARLAYCEHLMGHYSWLAAENKKTIEQLQAVASDNKRIIDQLQMNDARRKVDWVTRQQLDETRYKGGGHQRVEGRSGRGGVDLTLMREVREIEHRYGVKLLVTHM